MQNLLIIRYTDKFLLVIFAPMQPNSYSIGGYLQCKKTITEKIIAIDAMIDTMLIATAESIGGMGAGVLEYQLDDGQVKVRTTWRSPAEVGAGIKELEKLKQVYINRLNGRAVRLINDNTFRR